MFEVINNSRLYDRVCIVSALIKALTSVNGINEDE